MRADDKIRSRQDRKPGADNIEHCSGADSHVGLVLVFFLDPANYLFCMRDGKCDFHQMNAAFIDGVHKLSHFLIA